MASELRVDKIVPTDGIGNDTSTVKYGGGIIQIKQLQLTNNDVGGFFLQSGSTSYTQTNAAFSLSITPKFNTSKIYVSVITYGYLTTDGYAWTTIYRDSTNIGGSDRGMSQISGSSHDWNTVTMTLLDSPATTSAITYKIFGKCSSGATYYIGGDADLTNTITLMEVSA